MRNSVALLFLETVEIPHRRMNSDGHVVFAVHPGLHQSADAPADSVFLRHAIVVIRGKGGAAVRIKFVNAQIGIDFRDIVARVRHRDDRAVFNEHGQLPQRSVNIIVNLAALIQIPGEIINPLPFRQVNAMADVIPLLIRPGFLVNGRPPGSKGRRGTGTASLCPACRDWDIPGTWPGSWAGRKLIPPQCCRRTEAVPT